MEAGVLPSEGLGAELVGEHLSGGDLLDLDDLLVSSAAAGDALREGKEVVALGAPVDAVELAAEVLGEHVLGHLVEGVLDLLVLLGVLLEGGLELVADLLGEVVSELDEVGGGLVEALNGVLHLVLLGLAPALELERAVASLEAGAVEVEVPVVGAVRPLLGLEALDGAVLVAAALELGVIDEVPGNVDEGCDLLLELGLDLLLGLLEGVLEGLGELLLGGLGDVLGELVVLLVLIDDGIANCLGCLPVNGHVVLRLSGGNGGWVNGREALGEGRDGEGGEEDASH